MQRETQLRALCERMTQSTLATLPRRPLPFSAHQAASDLYAAVDAYTDAVLHNQQNKARQAAEKLATEALRVLMGYELPAEPFKVDRVRVEPLHHTETVET